MSLSNEKMSYTSSKKITAFRRAVWKCWKKAGRHALPWRLPTLKLRHGKKNFDPYRILVSEVMLQQTQVPRVIEKYKEFLKAFPNVQTLARSNLAQVLKVWSGLGYNRRGKYLHDVAKAVVEKYRGKVPRELSALRILPGIGPYTASAVRVFAYNEPGILIETNIRAAFIHHFFLDIPYVSDRQIMEYAEQAAKGQDSRTWHWALMDYGVHIKKLHKNPSRRSSSYVKQSKFEGSLRQVRGAILRTLSIGKEINDLRNRYSRENVSPDIKKFDEALAGLARDGLIVKVRPRRIGLGPKRGKWRIA